VRTRWETGAPAKRRALVSPLIHLIGTSNELGAALSCQNLTPIHGTRAPQ